MRILLLVLLAPGLLFTACEPGHEAFPAPDRLLATDVTDLDSSVLSYDSAGRLIILERHELTNNVTSFLKPVYENGRLTTILSGTSKNDITHKFKTFEYNSGGNVLKAYSYEYGADKYNRYDSLIYNPSDLIATIYVAAITAPGGSIGLVQKNVLEWNNYWNIAKKYSILMRDGKETKDTTVTVYTYDKRINNTPRQPILFYLQMDEPADRLSTQNVLTAITTSGNDSEEISNVLTYDNDYYPVEVISTTKALHNDIVVSTKQKNRKLTYKRL